MKKQVKFWGDSTHLKKPPPRKTAYFTSNAPSTRMTVLSII